MDLQTIVQALNLMVRSGADKLNTAVHGGYAGDLLSDVIANSHPGDIWITRQIHQNIIAVASLKDHAGIVLVQGSEPASDTLERARKEGIPLMVSDQNSFELIGRVYVLLSKEVDSERR